MVNVIALLSSLVCVVVALFAEPILELIGGAAYTAAAPAFVVVLLCLVLLVAAIPIGNAAAAGGGVAVNAAISTLGRLIAVVGTVVAAPEYGVTGTAVSLGLGLAVAGSLSLAYGFVHFGLPLRYQRRARDHRGRCTCDDDLGRGSR